MTGFNKRVHEVLVGVQVFATTHPHLFEKSSPTGQVLLERLDPMVENRCEAIRRLSPYGRTRVTSNGIPDHGVTGPMPRPKPAR